MLKIEESCQGGVCVDCGGHRKMIALSKVTCNMLGLSVYVEPQGDFYCRIPGLILSFTFSNFQSQYTMKNGI